jgi:hypothetical protein
MLYTLACQPTLKTVCECLNSQDSLNSQDGQGALCVKCTPIVAFCAYFFSTYFQHLCLICQPLWFLCARQARFWSIQPKKEERVLYEQAALICWILAPLSRQDGVTVASTSSPVWFMQLKECNFLDLLFTR